MRTRGEVLVCFAVGSEAAAFSRRCPDGCRVVVTGMGARRAAEGLNAALKAERPAWVLTCGFAGGLNPDLPVGTVVWEADADACLEDALRKAGAIPGRIHTADRVAVTVAEKRELRERTGADVVEMESGVIRGICRELGVASATIRTISDAAGDNLPLDFNALMTGDQQLSAWRLAWALIRSPGTIPGLMRLRRRCEAAADRLAGVLVSVLTNQGFQRRK